WQRHVSASRLTPLLHSTLFTWTSALSGNPKSRSGCRRGRRGALSTSAQQPPPPRLSGSGTTYSYSSHSPRTSAASPRLNRLSSPVGCEAIMYWVELYMSVEISAEAMEDLDPSEVQPKEGGLGENGAGYVLLFNCRAFETPCPTPLYPCQARS
ncbi:hypothetical protein B0H14DRAFT_3741641, partial [Mycena olivaceomarginata]